MQLPEWITAFVQKVKLDRKLQLWLLCGVLAAVLLILLVVAVCSVQPDLPAEDPSSVTQDTVPEETESTLPPPEANPYTPEDFYLEYGILKCSAGETILGIDVSAHQQVIDWEQVAAAGVEFVFIRIGYRGYVYGELHADEMFRANVDGAQAAGIRVGAYFFSQALSVGEAREEAEFALQLLEGIQLDLPLAYDWERMGEESRTAHIQRRTLTNITKTFCEIVKDAGFAPMIYFNSSQALELLHLEELTEYPFWLAMYDVTMAFPYRVDIWQYTNRGSIPGIETFVDVNVMFTEYGTGNAA